MRFDSYHPLVSLLFFAAVIVGTVQFTHPAFVAVGLACAFVFMLALRGASGVRYGVGSLAIGVVWAAGFTVTMHFGVTVLGWTLIGNAITLEALVCGAVQGMQLAALLLWLNCLVAVFTSDKVEYLLGRVSPRAAMAFSLLLRAVPVMNGHRVNLAAAQGGIGAGPGQGSLRHRIRMAGARAGAALSWGIEHSAAAQASMSCRGAQLKGRSAYSRYRFDTRDRGVVIALVALGTIAGVGAALGQTAMQFSPEIVGPAVTPASMVFLAVYAGFCLMPSGLQRVGEHHFAHSVARWDNKQAAGIKGR